MTTTLPLDAVSDRYVNVPTELKTIPRWMPFRLEWDEQRQKHNKVPCRLSGRKGSKTTPEHWADFNQAVEAASNGRGNGVGFVLWSSDDIIAIDIDHCIDEDGTLSLLVRKILAQVNSYAEFSPSGHGVRIFLRGQISRNHNSRNLGVELYHDKSYVTVTGNHIPGTPLRVEARYEEIATLEEELFPATTSPSASSRVVLPSLSREEVREMLRYIPPIGDYQDHWLRVLQAVHFELGDDGIELCEAWSPGREGEVAAKFASFKRSDGPIVSGRSLRYIAEQHGYPVVKNELKGARHVYERYLSAETLKSSARLLVIKSDRNTGKTTALAELYKDVERMLVMGHRRALLSNLAQRFGADYYRDVDDRPKTKRLAICANSLPSLCERDKKKRPQAPRPTDVLVIDEVEQFLAHFFGASFAGDRISAWRVLRWYLKNIKRQVAISDADASNTMVEVFKHLMGLDDNEVDIVVNDHHEAGINVVEYQTPARWYEALYQAIQAGDKAYITAVEQARILDLRDDLAKRFPGRRILCITGENSQSPEVRDILMSSGCKKMAENDIVLTSPAVSTGVSIDIEHFDSVWAYGDHGIIGGTDFVQQMRRVRNIVSNTIHMYLEPEGRIVGPEDAEELMEADHVKKHLVNLHFSRDLNGYEEDDYIEARAKIEAWQNRSRNHFARHVRQLLRDEGCTIVADTVKAEVDHLADQRDARQERSEMQVEEILNAEPLDEAEGELLDSVGYCPPGDEVRLKRYKILKRYGRIDREIVEKDLHEGLASKLEQLRDLYADDNVLRAHDEMDTKRDYAPGLPLRIEKKVLRREVLAVSGIGARFEGEPDIGAFNAWLTDENRRRLRAVLGVGVREGKEARALGDVLRQLGIGWTARKIKKTGKYNYHIDRASVDFMMGLLELPTDEPMVEASWSEPEELIVGLNWIVTKKGIKLEEIIYRE